MAVNDLRNKFYRINAAHVKDTAIIFLLLQK